MLAVALQEAMASWRRSDRVHRWQQSHVTEGRRSQAAKSGGEGAFLSHAAATSEQRRGWRAAHEVFVCCTAFACPVAARTGRQSHCVPALAVGHQTYDTPTSRKCAHQGVNLLIVPGLSSCTSDAPPKPAINTSMHLTISWLPMLQCRHPSVGLSSRRERLICTGVHMSTGHVQRPSEL
jgi:hypothetical protein